MTHGAGDIETVIDWSLKTNEDSFLDQLENGRDTFLSTVYHRRDLRAWAYYTAHHGAERELYLAWLRLKAEDLETKDSRDPRTFKAWDEYYLFWDWINR